ncbi:uncharacterized protein LOC128549696 isoform X3 [Mercenaria mercenaria]|uniref:uncharacterized protein LOC128549696 isoform X3 n=1 Tax=Mercenaria mercenaria TaxID=6596 RepID=UPI00234EF6CA|nr:uncharacterized protein LOC128549696 isoform X3 [Mercenaria mercenaria]
MYIYKLLLAVVLACVLNEGLAWWGESRRSSSRGGTSRRSSSGSSSSRRSSGWLGRRRNQQSNPAHMKEVIEGYEGMNLKTYDAQPNNSKVNDTTIA